MLLSFYKYQGTGNDFVIVDDRNAPSRSYNYALIQQLCDRRFGIGADGLMVLRNHPTHDFEVIYYNADGSQSLCGNGSRCAVHLAQQLGIIESSAVFVTNDGVHEAHIQGDDIHLKLNDVKEIKPCLEGYYLNTGSPHYVKWVDNLAALNIDKEGKAIRNHPMFQKEGTNVNFVAQQQDGSLAVRTYERGVEAETLSCGTGVVAVALVAATSNHSTIHTRGGKLQVNFTKKTDQTFEDIYLIGPAKQVYQGTIPL